MPKPMLKLSLLCKKYLFWWVVFISVFIPLYPKFPLFSIPGTYVAVRVEDFLIAVVICWWLIAIFPQIKTFVSETVTLTFLLFFSIGALSLFSAIFLTQTITPHLGFFHLLRRIEVMMLFFVSLSAFTSLKQVKIWLGAMFIATSVVILYGFGQQLLSFPVISTTNKEFSKGLGLFLSPDARVK